MNNELINIQNWLNASKLALNVDKSSFLIFHPHKRNFQIELKSPLMGDHLNMIKV